jgi:hypothetical protein
MRYSNWWHRSRALLVATAMALALLTPISASAVEGMWPLFDMDQLHFDSLHTMGLAIDPSQIYNAKDGGLAAAVVQVDGGTGAFVSPNGLIITNHHVARSAIQEQSTAQKNYVDDGFLARKLSEELPAVGYYCFVVKSYEDVTKKIRGALKPSLSPKQRHDTLEKLTKGIVSAAEKGRDVRCEVASFDGGLRYMLVTMFRIQDVRIVAVPPEGIGNFGGEIDNWMWPRHTGDYSFLRAYVAPDGHAAEYSDKNVPYHPTAFVPVSDGPLKEGDFSFVMGFPGGTSRFASSYELQDAIDFSYPTSIRYRRALIDIMDQAGQRDPEVAVRVSDRIAELANYLKNFEGMLTGMSKAHTLETRRLREADLQKTVNADPKLAKNYGNTLAGLSALYADHATYRDKSVALGWLSRASQQLGLANRLYKWSLQKTKPDMQREPGYMERNVAAMRRRMKDAQINMVPAVDRQMLEYVLTQAMRLPANQRIAPLDRLVGDTTSAGVPAAVKAFTEKLYANSKVGDVDERLKMFDETHDQLVARKDAFLDLAASLFDEYQTMKEKDDAFSGSAEKLNAELVAACREAHVGPPYPDANGTMRFGYGQVMGCSPADALHFAAFTTLGGVIEKETGVSPFNSPKRLLDVARQHDFGHYLDPMLGDVPVDFLTDHDTTGGSSGSPIFNARGELIGLCFDGNYEAIAGDYDYEQRTNRTINVDSRYILFTLDKVMGASELIKEMTVTPTALP